jgi:hypothetical protein
MAGAALKTGRFECRKANSPSYSAAFAALIRFFAALIRL